MKLLIGACLILFSAMFLFNNAERGIHTLLIAIGAILLFVGTALAYSSRELGFNDKKRRAKKGEKPK